MASEAHRWLVVGHTHYDTGQALLTDAWAYVEHEHKYQSEEELTHAVSLAGHVLLWQHSLWNHDVTICVEFLDEVRERWPELKRQNVVNWVYVWALVKAGENETAAEVFEEDVLTNPASEYRGLEKPTDYSIVVAYRRLGRCEEFMRHLPTTLHEHPESALAQTIAEYVYDAEVEGAPQP